MNHTAQLSSRESLLSEMRLATSGMLSKVGNIAMFAEANTLGREALSMAQAPNIELVSDDKNFAYSSSKFKM